MTDNLPERTGESLTELQERVRSEVTARYVARRPLPANAYVRPGLGDLPLSVQLRSALGLISDLLIPLVDGVEAKQPQVLECSVCRRNLGGWPPRVLEDHYWQHTWLQRRLAGIGIR